MSAPSADPAPRLNRNPAVLMDVQRCIRAAELRAQHWTFPRIAAELGFSSARAAQDAVRHGLRAVPAEDVREVRRMAADELHKVARSALGIIDDPGPLTSATGKVIVDEETGRPFPDQQARTAALRTLLDVNRELRKLYGADAPKQSVSMFAALSADEIRAMAAQVHSEALSAEREAVEGTIQGQIEGPAAS